MFKYLNFAAFFSRVQASPWYRDFLSPVIERIHHGATVLDIGTGSGELIRQLAIQKQAQCSGTDISRTMLNAARRKLNGIETDLHLLNPGDPFPFAGKRFDYVTICNVLFNLDERSGSQILDEAVRVVTHRGEILVLSPSGRDSAGQLFRQYRGRKNLSIYLWYYATRNRASPWSKENYLSSYAADRGLQYERKSVFHGYALLERIYP